MTQTRDTVMPALTEFVIPAQYRAPFPPMPKIQPTVLNRAEVQTQWPAFIQILDELDEYSEQQGRAAKMDGLVARRDVLAGAVGDAGFGDALVLNLPAVFEPCLAELATQQPLLGNWHSLDLMTCETLFEWRLQLDDGKRYALLIPEPAIHDLLQSDYGDRARVAFVPVLFVAGDSFVGGGFWFDLDDVFEAQAATVCSQSCPPYSDEELAEAAERALLAESTTPWKIRPWTDEDGVSLVQLQIYRLLGDADAPEPTDDQEF